MKKFPQIIIALGLLLLTLTACMTVTNAEGNPTPLVTQSQEAAREAQVLSLEIQVTPTRPAQVNAIVRGILGEACARLGETQMYYASNTFMITLLEISPSDRGCAQITTPFEQTIPLDTTGLPAGEYTVKANGVSAFFSLPADGTASLTPPVPVEPGQTKTFTSSLYGYQVSYPADWTIQINTSVPAGAGSNPEYITLTPNDGSSLPRIQVELLTGTPPMTGYENCDRNFVFHSLPACKISLPAGQNPATEIWVFQKDKANFYIAMQYEDEKSIQVFNDFMTSFQFTQ